MNDFMNKLLTRTSVRDFDETKKLSDQQRKDLIAAINSAPTSSNCQYFGCILIEDQKMIEEFCQQANFQEHVKKAAAFAIFYIDNFLLDEIKNKTKIDSDGNQLHLYTLGVVDATIASTQLQDAAISMGLGTCYIGAIRFYPDLIIEHLKLPKQNIPIVGLAIGFPKSINEVKPKMNKVYLNFYDSQKAIAELNNYDEILKKYLVERKSNPKNLSFSEMTAKIHQKTENWFDHWTELIENAYPKLKK